MMPVPASDLPDHLASSSMAVPADDLPDGGVSTPKRPSTTAAGIAASAARGMGPMAAGAAIGAAAGAPFAGVGAIPGAAIGAGAMGLTEMALDLYNPIAAKMGLPKAATPQEATDKLFDLAGIRRPTTATERTVQATAGGLAAGGGQARAAQEAGKLLSGPASDFATRLGEGPLKQAISGATGGAAAQTAAEAGAGPIGQFVAGMVGGATPYAAELPKSIPSMTPKAGIRDAAQAGYVFPPAEMKERGTSTDRLTAAMSGEAGKIKLQQSASVKNQAVTNGLAAGAIGLPRDTALTEQAFDNARKPAAAVYNQVTEAVPEVRLGADKTYLGQAANVGGRNSLVEKFFPEIGENPGILALRKTLVRNESVPTDVAMKTIADLRHQADANFRAVGDAQKHALALAQREAADAMEGAVERAVQKAPAYFAEKFNDAITGQRKASDAINDANKRLTQARATMATNSNVYTWAAAKREEQAAIADLSRANNEYESATKGVESWRSRLRTAHDQNESNQTLLDRFRDARKLFARIYDVESATNRTTGDVSARGIARIYNKGRPMDGDLKTIADAANLAPKSMQVPAMFGHDEDWSALDFFGTMGSIAAGHPAAAAGIVARPWVRGLVLKPAYQARLLGTAPPPPTPLSIFDAPGAWGVVQPPGSAAAIVQQLGLPNAP